MSNQVLENSIGIQKDRRRFLIGSGLGAASLLFSPLNIAGESLIGQDRPLGNRDNIFEAVSRYANAIGAFLVADSLTQFIRMQSLLPSAREILDMTNRDVTRILEDKDPRFSSARVYRLNYEDYFFYSVQDSSKFNACVAFFDYKNKEQPDRVALIAGPALWGISNIAEEIAKERSTSAARRLLIPRETKNESPGDFDRSYSYDFRTDEGSVSTTYETKGNGVGTVSVSVVGLSGETLGRGKYPVTYR